MSGKTVAVTGASGYIGSVLVDHLAARSLNIVRVSRQELALRDGMKSIRADVRSPDCWRTIVEAADVIFHLAGNTSVYAAADNPSESLMSTVMPVNLLVAAARELGRRPRVVYASTATVYGMTDGLGAVNETFEPRPITVYDLHKNFAEQQLALATRDGLIEGVALRLANVYGVSSSLCSAEDRGVLNKVTEIALQGKDLTVYGTGNYLRDYVYIDDVVQAFILAGLRGKPLDGPLNVATGRSVSLKDAFVLVGEAAQKLTGRSIRIMHAPWPANASAIEYRNYNADISRLSEALGWSPEVSLEAGISRMIASRVRAALPPGGSV